MSNTINLSSENIKIFPFGTSRPEYDPECNQLTEHNIASILKTCFDKNCVISYDDTSKLITFVIAGYIVSANIEEAQQENTPLYANILVDTSGVVGIDKDDTLGIRANDTVTETKVFGGVEFSTSPLQNREYLQLLDADGQIPVESYFKFNFKSLPNNIIWKNF